MPALKLDDSFGYVEVEITTAGGMPGQPPVRLDAWEGWNHYIGLTVTHADDAVALGVAWCTWLAERGLVVSHGAAFRVADALKAAIDEAKKNDPASTSAASNASTGSPSSA